MIYEFSLLILALSSTSVSIRLVNNSTATEGLIQVYYSGRWGLICGNNWGDFDAKVSNTLWICANIILYVIVVHFCFFIYNVNSVFDFYGPSFR